MAFKDRFQVCTQTWNALQDILLTHLPSLAATCCGRLATLNFHVTKAKTRLITFPYSKTCSHIFYFTVWSIFNDRVRSVEDFLNPALSGWRPINTLSWEIYLLKPSCLPITKAASKARPSTPTSLLSHHPFNWEPGFQSSPCSHRERTSLNHKSNPFTCQWKNCLWDKILSN